MPEQPLTAEMRRAADLRGRNWTYADIAFEVKVSEKTLQRWGKRDDFAALVKESREALLDKVPNAKATLEAALSATTKTGDPDWPIRVKAAQLLLTSADPNAATEPEPDRRTFVFVPTDGDDADAG